MIPTIGTMLAGYIVTRMFDLALTQPGEAPSKFVRILAVLTIVWTLLCALDLVISGSSVPRM